MSGLIAITAGLAVLFGGVLWRCQVLHNRERRAEGSG